MATRNVVDSDVLVYAHDTDAGARHATGKALLAEVWDSRTGSLSTQVLLNPESAFDLQLVFLNASAPNATLPQAESNFTGSGSEAGSTVPDIVDSPLPVKSYDIAIYSNDGKVLWQKTNQPGEGGRPGQRIEFEGNYTGPVTIKVTNIKPGWETATASEDLTDSVTFTATVVPEFPAIAVLPLAIGVFAVIVAFRLKRTLAM